VARARETFPCPVCGDDVPVGALACKGCGADDRTGWKDDDDVTTTQDLGLEQTLDDEQYEDFLREDEALGRGRSSYQPSVSRFGLFLTILGILAVAALLAILTTGKPS
jgi:hypothetical protein